MNIIANGRKGKGGWRVRGWGGERWGWGRKKNGEGKRKLVALVKERRRKIEIKS